MNEFNMFFHGEELSLLEQICMESFVKHGHSLNVFTYDDLVVPEGVITLDARQILPHEKLFFFDNSPSAFSNIFRYKLILETGGWWVDTDVLCLTDEIPNCDYAWAYQDPDQINGAILKLPKGDPLCAELLEQSIERSKNITAWGQLGPGLLTELLSDANPADHFGSQQEFYPTHWIDAHLCWMPGRASFIHSRIENATFLHLWNSLLGRMNINLNTRAPKGSFFEELVAPRYVAKESSKELEEEITHKIRYILDYEPRYRSLYEEKMGLNWQEIYPALG